MIKGSKITEAHKLAISISRKGKPLTMAHRRALSQSQYRNDTAGIPKELHTKNGAKTNNVHAKQWHFVNKRQRLTIKGRNLNQLVRDNTEYFAYKDILVYHDTRQCNASTRLRLLSDKEEGANWKGWAVA